MKGRETQELKQLEQNLHNLNNVILCVRSFIDFYFLEHSDDFNPEIITWWNSIHLEFENKFSSQKKGDVEKSSFIKYKALVAQKYFLLLEAFGSDYPFFKEVKNSLKRARIIIQTMLSDFEEEFNVGLMEDLIKDVMASIGRSFPGIEFDLEMRVKGTVYAQLNTFKDCLDNLLRNAAEAIERSAVEKGLIKVFVGLDNGFLIRIEDNGCGMDADTKSKLFNSGFTTKQTKEGHGLGMGSVKQTIESHGGTIEVESQLGEGSTFTIHFPIDRLIQS